MRIFITLAFVLLANWAMPQEPWRRLLLVDPYMANGYFLVNEELTQELGATMVTVDLLHKVADGDGGFATQVIQHLEMTPPSWYTHVDLDLLPQLAPGDRATYRVQAVNASGDIVQDFEPTDGSQPREEICRSTCNGAAYAWTLVAMQNEQQSNTVISIQNGTSGGQYFYFYVKGTQWQDFQVQFSPDDFGLGGLQWSDYPSTGNPDDVLHITNSSQFPSSPRDYQGLPLGLLTNEQSIWAIRKDRGQWRELFATTAPLIGTNYCEGANPGLLRTLYNADAEFVQFAMSQNNLPPLTCTSSITSGGGVEWGHGGIGICTTFSYSDGSEDNDGDGDLDPVGWVTEAIACPPIMPEVYSEPSLTDVSSIIITQWQPEQVSPVLTIEIPDQGDARLVPVPKTPLPAGLYEYKVVFDDGQIWRKFQSYDSQKVITANFASFTNVLAYPVPVTDGSFSLDFDLLAPMSMTLSVINNQGTVYYSEALAFEFAGRNKHVVNMNAQWPDGLYHCIIGYQDGSSETVSITVD